MIKVNLKLISEFLPSKEEEIEITLAEIIELAKEKIKNQYENDIYNTIIYRNKILKQLRIFLWVILDSNQ